MSAESDVPRPTGSESQGSKTPSDAEIVWAGLPIEFSAEFQKCLSFHGTRILLPNSGKQFD